MTFAQIVAHMKFVDNFTSNLDESCMRAEDGHLHIVGSKNKHKHEKNLHLLLLIYWSHISKTRMISKNPVSCFVT